MFPDSSRATTPLAPIATKPQDDEQQDVDRTVDRGRAPSWASSEGASTKSPEPHWDSVIGAATD
jgi:hypothetical protein